MGRSSSLDRARRPLPANLSLDQRRALEQFLDGQISAGAMSSKLDQAEPGGPPANPDWQPSHRPAPPMAAPTPRRRVAFPATLMATLLLAIIGTYAVASASTSSEKPGRANAAKVTVKASRTRHHRGAARTDQSTLVSAASTGSTTAGSSTPKRAHHATTPGKAHGRGLGRKDGPAKPEFKPKADRHPAGPAPQPGTQTTAAGGGGTGSPSGGTAPTGGASSGQGTTTSPGTTTNPAPSASGDTSSIS